MLYFAGFVGPLSARIRGLFVRHTRTGNPLVDSVAEHQATPPTAYLQYFHNVCLLGPIGALALFLRRGAIAKESRTARKFVLLYLFLACYFSGKMIRLVLLLSPAASIVAGYVVASVYGWAFKETFLPVPSDMEQRAALSVKVSWPKVLFDLLTRMSLSFPPVLHQSVLSYVGNVFLFIDSHSLLLACIRCGASESFQSEAGGARRGGEEHGAEERTV